MFISNGFTVKVVISKVKSTDTDAA